MAKVIWNKQAETEWRKRLLKHPKAGIREPLLRNRRKVYRYFHLIGPLKLLYYYLESSDTIRITDIWDSRREPKKLVKRIR